MMVLMIVMSLVLGVFLLVVYVLDRDSGYLLNYDEFYKELNNKNISELVYKSQFEIRGKFKEVPAYVRERSEKTWATFSGNTTESKKPETKSEKFSNRESIQNRK